MLSPAPSVTPTAEVRSITHRDEGRGQVRRYRRLGVQDANDLVAAVGAPIARLCLPASLIDFNLDFGVAHTKEGWEAGVVTYNFGEEDLRTASLS